MKDKLKQCLDINLQHEMEFSKTKMSQMSNKGFYFKVQKNERK